MMRSVSMRIALAAADEERLGAGRPTGSPSSPAVTVQAVQGVGDVRVHDDRVDVDHRADRVQVHRRAFLGDRHRPARCAPGRGRSSAGPAARRRRAGSARRRRPRRTPGASSSTSPPSRCSRPGSYTQRGAGEPRVMAVDRPGQRGLAPAGRHRQAGHRDLVADPHRRVAREQQVGQRVDDEVVPVHERGRPGRRPVRSSSWREPGHQYVAQVGRVAGRQVARRRRRRVVAEPAVVDSAASISSSRAAGTASVSASRSAR